MTTYRIQQLHLFGEWTTLTDDEGFPLEFLSLSNAEYVAKRMLKYVSLVRIVDSHGCYFELERHEQTM